MKKPDFLIIGVQKGGSTSLFKYLMEHPQIASPVDKEIHFFDLNFDHGWDWYISQFPYLQANNNVSSNLKLITGEASPYYIYHPLVAQRVKEYCPQIKLIVLLRDPVSRAISHYYHCLNLKLEFLSIEEAFNQEFSRLNQEEEKLKADPKYYSYNHQHLSYLSRGKYFQQLAHWKAYFPAEQFLIIQSETFYKNPSKILKQVTDFLGLESYQLSKYYHYNKLVYPQVSRSIINQLTEYFEPDNEKLYTYLQTEFSLPEKIHFSNYSEFWHLKLKNNELQRQNEQIYSENQHLFQINQSLKNAIQTEQEKNQKIVIKTEEIKQLTEQIQAMESSKFWQIRQLWFKLKQKFGLT